MVPTAAFATVVMGITEPFVPAIDVQNLEDFTKQFLPAKSLWIFAKIKAWHEVLGTFYREVLVAAVQGGSTSAFANQ